MIDGFFTKTLGLGHSKRYENLLHFVHHTNMPRIFW